VETKCVLVFGPEEDEAKSTTVFSRMMGPKWVKKGSV